MSLRDVTSHFGRVEGAFALSLVLWLAVSFLAPGSLAAAVVPLIVWVLAFLSAIRLSARAVRESIWRLRNRLIVAYLFIAVVPVLLIAILAFLGIWALSGQVGVYLAGAELERRLTSLRGMAQSIARMPEPNRPDAVRRFGFVFRDRFPGLEILVSSANGGLRYPEDATLTPPPVGTGEDSGLVLKDGYLYAWTHIPLPDAAVTVTAPITRSFLTNLVPGLGVIGLRGFRDPTRPARERAMRTFNNNNEDVAAVPPSLNPLDFEVAWFTIVPVSLWESPGESDVALLAVQTRISGVLRIVLSREAAWDQPAILYFFFGFAGLFLIVELIAFIIGVSLTRTITGAVHELYEGTHHVLQGDFSHRIRIHGHDQLAELGRSFNAMTENLQRLVVVEKEKERLHSEIEIAREVQGQLHPKVRPELPCLELTASCHAARLVSGDYYDYQQLEDGRLALALGDVAGKGVSAALLMATIQSSFRTQLQGGETPACTTGIVTRLNQHLYASTALEKYATFCCGLYNDADGTLTYTNAGHLPPLLFRNGDVIRLEINGMVVGAFPFARYGESCLRMESGDLLLFYTDGVTEPENEYGEMFGEERLIETVLRHRDASGQQIVEAVIEAVHDWTGAADLQDDMTMLIARRL